MADTNISYAFLNYKYRFCRTYKYRTYKYQLKIVKIYSVLIMFIGLGCTAEGEPVIVTNLKTSD